MQQPFTIQKEQFQKDFIQKLETKQGRTLADASKEDLYIALAATVRDVINKRWVMTNRVYHEQDTKEVYYFSLEFLIGKLLYANLLNMGVLETVEEALKEIGVDLSDLEDLEPDPGLGNGGLGRLAACFLDSLASLQLPGHGNGIRYKYGLFEQKLENGYQQERPDNWLKSGNPWEIRRPENAVEVKFFGDVRVEWVDGKAYFRHENYTSVMAIPYDTAVVGYHNNTVNTLRLWSAEPTDNVFDINSFNRGDYMKAVEDKYSAEAITQVLYPADSNRENKILRLKQQYFFVAAGLGSIIARFKKRYPGRFDLLPEHVSIHINDTHPALCVAELMRILMDEEGLGWDEAFRITVGTLSYTNHTIMSEALETWPIDIFKPLLPRIYMIVEEVDRRFRERVRTQFGGDEDRVNRMAILSNGRVHMANLAIVGSHSINGVAALHTNILKSATFRDFYEMFPLRFNNKTNGITHRRWLLKANPKLTDFICDCIGDTWISHPEDMEKLEAFCEDDAALNRLDEIKLENKKALADYIYQKHGVKVRTDAIFDVQVKRIHAYKRQLLNILHVLDLYNRIKDNPSLDMVPRVFIFGGKAAPNYYLAKMIIKFINTVGDMINNDPVVGDRLKVFYLENYRVSLAEKIFPASDVSEQISTASKEASGTGNMKFMMNGAVTIGTLDGANVEIKDSVGADNIFIFGLTADEVMNFERHGGYSSWDIYNSDPRVSRILNQIRDGEIPDPQGDFRELFQHLLAHNDPFFVLRDFAAYCDAQKRVDEAYRDRRKWLQMSLTNIAHSGRFSSDSTIMEYAHDIWHLKATPVPEPKKAE